MGASNMMNRANTLVNIRYGENLPSRLPGGETWTKSYMGNDMQNDYTDLRKDYSDGETRTKSYPQSSYTDLASNYSDIGTGSVYDKTNDYNNTKNSLVNEARKLIAPLEKLEEEYIDEEMGVLNRKGGRFFNKLYINNEEFREEIINFVRDKKELDLDLILDKRCKTYTLNTLGNKCLAECITSKSNTKDLIEIMANNLTK